MTDLKKVRQCLRLAQTYNNSNSRYAQEYAIDEIIEAIKVLLGPEESEK